ncbi:MAG: phosphoenolpyruvate--protein phosphotransferase [Thiobacillaceae bacterium]|nr:phosphoenolpyruvate--protein phosphotransferase [Thiobacillaceae bacterium]MCX7672938.1 phosphoenolpyruvate--protein phosphotransferase [Thiobacillaceae bacterium]MDW8324903.1 phosphoenolpyruvate--protein phosphotransferase [Burkholderiales bacterium]
MPFTLHGIGVSGGYAIGRAQLFSHDRLEAPHYVLRREDLPAEIARYDEAVSAVRAELTLLQDQLPEHAPAELAAFLDVHRLILEDSMIAEAPKRLIEAERCNAEWALAQQTQALIDQFEAMEDPYLRERKHDVRQVSERIMKALMGHPGHAPLKTVGEEASVLVAHDLSPSDMVLFKRQNYAAFITDLGGATSHTAILARSLNIPAVMALHNARALIREGDVLVVDGEQGVVIVEPDQAILEEYRIRQNQWRLEQQKLKRLKKSPAATLDGTPIELMANIDLPQDVQEALEQNAAGIGLFRSEFLYMNRSDLPGEDEQFEAYRAVVEAMKGRPVVIRTLDLGADKRLPWLRHESINPALGLRAIRLCLSEPPIFLTQVRALLRAACHGDVRILLPMLANLKELNQALELIAQAKAELDRAGRPYRRDVPIGGMIEVPAAALAVEWFARRLDFLSIGTNDLIQYTLAIDRTDDSVAHLYDPLHPAVLRLIHHTLRVAARLGKPVSICGEMAGDAQLTRLLLAFGLRSFSMHPAHLLKVKQRILHSDLRELGAHARRLLREGEAERIHAYVQRLNA